MKRLVLALLLAALLAALVVTATDLRAADVAAVLSDLSWGHVAGALGVYAVSYFGRALRLSTLMQRPAPLLHLASISARHTFLNMVLPFRSGEASLPLLLKGETGRSLAEGAAALFVCRVLDLAWVCAFLLLGVALGVEAGDAGAPAIVGRVALVLAALALGLAALRPAARRWGPRLAGPGRVRDFLSRSAAHMGAVSSPRLASAAAVSGVTWLLTYVACWLLVLAMGRGATARGAAIGPTLDAIDFPTSLVGTTGLHLTGILPINTPGSVGAWEAGWTAGYVLAGVEKTAAAASAVGAHVLIFGFAIVLAGLGQLLRPTPMRPGPRAGTLM